jgi:hypothetical protein
VPDHLTIKATGVVRFNSAIGNLDPLESLTIAASTVTPTGLPKSVFFDQDVVLHGPLVIDTDGAVVFSRKLTITGGSLTIRGASLIEFNDTVNVNGGAILLEGDEINLKGSSTLKSTGGVLTLRSTTLNLGMEVGSPAGVDVVKLDISATELEAISAGGFSKIVLGHVDVNGHATAGQGQVRIAGAVGANQYTFQAPLEVYGHTITIEDIASAANPGLAIKGSVKLDATSHIDIRNRLLASTDLSQASAVLGHGLRAAKRRNICQPERWPKQRAFTRRRSPGGRGHRYQLVCHRGQHRLAEQHRQRQHSPGGNSCRRRADPAQSQAGQRQQHGHHRRHGVGANPVQHRR